MYAECLVFGLCISVLVICRLVCFRCWWGGYVMRNRVELFVVRNSVVCFHFFFHLRSRQPAFNHDRIYMLVTNYSPLTCYLHRGGFARFSGTRFSMNIDDITNSTMHLTNAAVQKQSKEYNKERGCKMDIRDLKLYMISKHGTEAVDACFADMEEIMIKSLESVANIIINEKNCFEMYGYDLMIDEDLKPWLIEVNASPSVTADTDSDYRFKFGLLDDTLDVIDMEGVRNGDEDQIGAYDLVYYQGKRYKKESDDELNSRLGCYNVRSKEFSHLTKKGKGK
eukprot:TRINITY_DN2121_c0_g1_i2.p1 TRINITY_DN2121_c0_g1~~TRINITY_DN2121_c0_g1_i2.p1  ORF type:complete len:281 (-),score=78.02 TRINITY_DN2121_c0_g1_i2:187-1029(-)